MFGERPVLLPRADPGWTAAASLLLFVISRGGVRQRAQHPGDGQVALQLGVGRQDLEVVLPAWMAGF